MDGCLLARLVAPRFDRSSSEEEIRRLDYARFKGGASIEKHPIISWNRHVSPFQTMQEFAEAEQYMNGSKQRGSFEGGRSVISRVSAQWDQPSLHCTEQVTLDVLQSLARGFAART
jgi:hypothetical protein